MTDDENVDTDEHVDERGDADADKYL